MKGRVVGIIAAAGRGERLGAGGCKALVPLCGRPIIGWTAEALARSELIRDIIVVGIPGALEAFREAVRGIPKVRRVIEGGENRVGSVMNGFKAAGEDCDIMVVHDGARPFIDEELTGRVIVAAQRWGAAIPAVPFVCTAKAVTPDMFVDGTIDRRGIWEAQTPQAFSRDLLRDAYGSCRGGVEITDESLIAELAGARVKVVEGSYDNIKITTPVDLKLAELLLIERERAGESR